MFRRTLSLTILLLSNYVMPSASAQKPTGDYLVYVGSYPKPKPDIISTAKGIYAFRFDSKSAALTPIGLVGPAMNPAHVWASPDGRFLYAVNWQTGDETDGDTVSAYSIDQKTGALTFLNKVSSHGDWPNQVMLDPSGKVAVTVTYKSGTTSAFPIEPNGHIGEAFYTDQHAGPSIGHEPPGPHGHGVEFSTDGRFAYVAELGLDRVYSYRLDAAKRVMTPCDPPFVAVKSGSGPRRLQLHPNGRFLYVNLETTSAVSVFEVNDGRLKEIQSLSTLPTDFKDTNLTAEIQIDQTGRFLYVSNRGHDSIACYRVDPVKGTLTMLEIVPSLGKAPRNLRIDPTNNYLLAANQFSESIAVFRIDHDTGHLTPVDVPVAIPQPGGIIFVKAP